MANFSFDVVSEFDKAEMNNVYDQTQREISTRYDFKNTPAAIEWLNTDKTGFKIIGNSDWQVDAIIDILRKKIATRGVSQKVLDVRQETIVSNMKSSKMVSFKSGLDAEKAKKLTTLLREKHPKAKAQIQGEVIRITSNSKDILQAIMQDLQVADYDFPISFTNYR
jgi:uncharacterized protein YajQ (UPF0234 family)